MISDLLFSEVYGCYYTVVARILNQSKVGMHREEIEKLVCTDGFYDSAFHMLPKLFSNEWQLLDKKEDGKFYSKLSSKTTRPMTLLEKSWMKSLLTDKRIRLFLSENDVNKLNTELSDVEQLFLQEDFHVFDAASDGDPYDSEQYRINFRIILQACNSGKILDINYEPSTRTATKHRVFPYKISYSSHDDKFRLLGVLLQDSRYKSITLNVSRIRDLSISDKKVPSDFQPERYFDSSSSEPIVLQISKERNALERCMLQFASWEKQTEYDEENDVFICRIFYNSQDETELLIRILSFGPVVKVLSPEHFLHKIKERIYKQFKLNSSEFAGADIL